MAVPSLPFKVEQYGQHPELQKHHQEHPFHHHPYLGIHFMSGLIPSIAVGGIAAIMSASIPPMASVGIAAIMSASIPPIMALRPSCLSISPWHPLSYPSIPPMASGGINHMDSYPPCSWRHCGHHIGIHGPWHQEASSPSYLGSYPPCSWEALRPSYRHPCRPWHREAFAIISGLMAVGGHCGHHIGIHTTHKYLPSLLVALRPSYRHPYHPLHPIISCLDPCLPSLLVALRPSYRHPYRPWHRVASRPSCLDPCLPLLLVAFSRHHIWHPYRPWHRVASLSGPISIVGGIAAIISYPYRPWHPEASQPSCLDPCLPLLSVALRPSYRHPYHPFRIRGQCLDPCLP